MDELDKWPVFISPRKGTHGGVEKIAPMKQTKMTMMMMTVMMTVMTMMMTTTMTMIMMGTMTMLTTIVKINLRYLRRVAKGLLPVTTNETPQTES